MASFTRKFCAKNKISSELREKPSEDEVTRSDIVNFENKVELAERMRKANREVLAEIVRTVEAQCKDALDEIDADRIQIKIDSLDKETYNKLWELVEGPAKTLKKIKF